MNTKDIANVPLTKEVIQKWLSFDKDNLDEEFLLFPMQIYRVGTEAVQAVAERDRAKQELEMIDAKLDARIRTSPEKYGIEKVSESAISKAIMVQADHIKAQETFSDYVTTASNLQTFHNSMRDKLTCMTYEFKAWESGYFSGRAASNRESKGAGEAAVEKSQRESLKGGRLQR